ncbi:AAA family ATPase [Holdemanella biformis]|uniref:AAA family ATPase n=1 Tax=Holdemanella biformis TaxID=1735 RepID=UPI0020B79FF6|nr:AAA family ATPase [Holdemanella biformis]
MRIDSITLVNFRQYKNAEISFSKDPNKNITIILGENGYGKTTLIRAFIWCLYPTTNIGFENKILLNSEVAEQMATNQEKDVVVTIKLEHGGCDYVITTKETYTKTGANQIVGKKAITKMKKNNPDKGDIFLTSVPDSRISNEIENILGSELKDYFFYDGETNKIESAAKRNKVQNAISKLMGIKRIETLKDYFDPTRAQSVVSYLANDLKGEDIDVELYKEELDELKKELEEKKDSIKTHESEINRIENDLYKKEAYLDANQEILALQQEKKRLDKSISIDKKDIEQSFYSICKDLSGPNMPLLSKLQSYIYLKYNLNDLPNNTEFNNEESLSYISEQAIDQLIERGYCLCGAKITSENDAYKHLIKAKDHMEPHDYGRYLSSFCSGEDVSVGDSKNIEKSLFNQIVRYQELVEDTENNEERLKDIIEKIKGIPDVGQTQSDIGNLKAKKVEHETEIRYLSQDIENIKYKINKKDVDLEKIISKNKENLLTNECKRYARYIFGMARIKVDKKKTEVRKKLQDEVNVAFNKMYHGNRMIEITTDFKAKTLTDNQELDNSTGIETVKNFAYVSGILRLIKEAFGTENDAFEETIDEIYPLVMDAPFSNTDEEHISRICAVLPDYCNQLIMVMIRKDYKIAQNSIEDRIGKIYEIDKISETHDAIRLVNDYVNDKEEY